MTSKSLQNNRRDPYRFSVKVFKYLIFMYLFICFILIFLLMYFNLSSLSKVIEVRIRVMLGLRLGLDL